MGWKCYYSGSLPDIILQEKVIKFIQNSFPSPPDLIVKPYPDIKYDVRVYYGKSVDEAGQIHSCCNDFCHEKAYSPSKGRANVEQIIRDYPCNYFGIIQWCNRKDGTINGGQFIFDRTAGGLLINISKLFPIYLSAQTENENKEIPEPESMVQINLRGIELYEWPLLLNIIKLRWWPDLECSDDEDACAEVAHDIRKYGLAKKLMDENLNYDECIRLMNIEHEKYFPPPPSKPRQEDRSTSSILYSDEKELLESIQSTRELIEICKDFIKGSENSVKRYEDFIKQYPSNPNYKSCLEEAEESLAKNKEALKQAKETLNEKLEIYKNYYGKKETLH